MKIKKQMKIEEQILVDLIDNFEKDGLSWLKIINMIGINVFLKHKNSKNKIIKGYVQVLPIIKHMGW